ncbi:APH(3') family aminoglycoside O-phosphotransferase [Nocardia sp. NPDC127526]|uniref:APH(3') family aminoglycoside O-phosphotransferase n=1 Tax=Nocardia sp. NPDC127526 TaxID=3345393 RepID=UPI003630A3F4
MGSQSPFELPPAVRELFGADPEFSDDHEGASGGVVNVNGIYWMKKGPEAVAEHERLTWLETQGLPVPKVALFEADVLVLADAGVASLASAEVDSPGAAMAEALRRLHALPIADCPFDARIDTMLRLARRQVEDGLVDAEDFDDDNAGRTPEAVLEQLIAERPEVEDLVVVHGDYTPSNVLEGGMLIDLGRLGVADRYRDIALALRDLDDDFGPGEVAAFLAAYELSEPDQRRVHYYRLLDELF